MTKQLKGMTPVRSNLRVGSGSPLPDRDVIKPQWVSNDPVTSPCDLLNVFCTLQSAINHASTTRDLLNVFYLTRFVIKDATIHFDLRALIISPSKQYIPVGIWRPNGMHKKESAILRIRGSNQRDWPVKLRFYKDTSQGRKDRLAMTKGWREFCSSNNIKKRDDCTFEIMDTAFGEFNDVVIILARRAGAHHGIGVVPVVTHATTKQLKGMTPVRSNLRVGSGSPLPDRDVIKPQWVSNDPVTSPCDLLNVFCTLQSAINHASTTCDLLNVFYLTRFAIKDATIHFDLRALIISPSKQYISVGIWRPNGMHKKESAILRIRGSDQREWLVKLRFYKDPAKGERTGLQ
ncbi:UNVERIFIED_CONTAM: hypothetical protein Sindi_0323500 [Sesamum indicum]